MTSATPKAGNESVDDPRKWVRIYDHLLNQIFDGTLQTWDRCPPISETVRQWGVSRKTAAKAYRNLAEDGYLQRFPGTGYIVSGHADLNELRAIRTHLGTS